jgi:acetyltransferase EpsM
MNYDFNIILIGAGDSSVEVVDYLLNDKNFNTKLFSISIYDDNFKNKKFFKKLSIRIKLNKIKKLKFTKAKNTKYLITFGNTKLRKKYELILLKKKLNLFKLIHSSAQISKTAKIGNGSIVAPLCVVGSYATINKNVYINSGALIGHHTQIKKNSVISPNCFFGGNVSIGNENFVGGGTIIYPGVKILNNCKIVAGSSITKNVASNSFVYGNPAKMVKNHIKD